MSLVSAVAFVPRGFAAQWPRKIEYQDSEYEEIIAVASRAKRAAKKKQKSTKNDEDAKLIAEYRLENYDDSSDSDEMQDGLADGEAKTLKGFVKNMSELVYYAPNEKDPHLQEDAVESDEQEDIEIRQTDNLFLIARTEAEISHIEVCVFDASSCNLYVHHDFLLPTFPICMEWLDYIPYSLDTKPGNFVAIGTMEPEIEIWNLDHIDTIWPDAILGNYADNDTQKIKNKPRKSPKNITRIDAHQDAVLGLSSNKLARNLLLSCSADTTIKLWDLSSCKPAKTWESHDSKVTTVSWNPSCSYLFLSAGYDKKVSIFDARMKEAALYKKMDSEIECGAWNSFQEPNFFIGTSNGDLFSFDMRNSAKDIHQNWVVRAHDGPISSISCNENIQGLLATSCSEKIDRKVKIWDFIADPKLLSNRNLGVGIPFSIQFAPDPQVCMFLGVGGSENSAKIWDTGCNKDLDNVLKRVPKEFLVEQDFKNEFIEIMDRVGQQNEVDDD